MLGKRIVILSLFHRTFKSRIPISVHTEKLLYLVSCFPFIFWIALLIFSIRATCSGRTNVLAHWSLSGAPGTGGNWERIMALASGGRLWAQLPIDRLTGCTQVNGWTFSCFCFLGSITMGMNLTFLKGPFLKMQESQS